MHYFGISLPAQAMIVHRIFTEHFWNLRLKKVRLRNVVNIPDSFSIVFRPIGILDGTKQQETYWNCLHLLLIPAHILLHILTRNCLLSAQGDITLALVIPISVSVFSVRNQVTV